MSLDPGFCGNWVTGWSATLICVKRTRLPNSAKISRILGPYIPVPTQILGQFWSKLPPNIEHGLPMYHPDDILALKLVSTGVRYLGQTSKCYFSRFMLKEY